MNNFLIYALINVGIFIIALAFHFGVKERGAVNMLEQFDEYQKKKYNPTEYIKNFYDPNDYQRDPNRGKHTAESHQYVDIFANQPRQRQPQAAPNVRRDTAGRLVKKVTSQNPALEQAFRELQSEFQRKRIDKR